MIKKLSTIVGFREEKHFENVLTEAMKTTDSGLLFQDAHALLTLKNIRLAAPFDYEDDEMNDEAFSNWLVEKEEAAISKVLTKVRQEKKLGLIEKQQLDRQTIISKVGMLSDKEIKQDRFVGFILTVNSPKQIYSVLDSISLQTTQAQTLPIYIFHSEKEEAVHIVPVAQKKENYPNWNDVHFEMQNEDSDKNGSYWLIGYYEDDLQGQALNSSSFDFINNACGSCGGVDTRKAWSKSINVQPFCVEMSNLPDKGKIPAQEDFIFTAKEGKTYGLNMKISAYCSSYYLLKNQSLNLANAIFYQFAVDMMQELSNTTRVSSLSERTQQRAYNALNGTEEEVALISILQKEFETLSIEFNALGGLCLPDGNFSVKRGVIGNS